MSLSSTLSSELSGLFLPVLSNAPRPFGQDLVASTVVVIETLTVTAADASRGVGTIVNNTFRLFCRPKDMYGVTLLAQKMRFSSQAARSNVHAKSKKFEAKNWPKM